MARLDVRKAVKRVRLPGLAVEANAALAASVAEALAAEVNAPAVLPTFSRC